MLIRVLRRLKTPWSNKSKEVMGILERDTGVAKACKQFRPRIEVVVAADCDFN
jgi:hypothetical protein